MTNITRSYELYDWNQTAESDIIADGENYGFEVESFISGGSMEYIVTLCGPEEVIVQWEDFFDMESLEEEEIINE